MTDDEHAIRSLVERWIAASKAADLNTILSLIADDAVFMVPGQEPFGKDLAIEGENEIQEIKVLGDWAYLRNRLSLTITSKNGKPVQRSGYTLTILRKEPSGNWLLVRDANLMTNG
jgi:ketosteroid isomerase-like protein